MSKLLYKDITEKIIGCAMRVHSHFESGFPEIIYKRALIIEPDKRALIYTCEIEKDIYYRGSFLGKRRLDLIAEDKVLLELKTLSEITNKDFAQVINYLNVFQIKMGLLLNSGQQSLQYKRFINSKKSAN